MFALLSANYFRFAVSLTLAITCAASFEQPSCALLPGRAKDKTTPPAKPQPKPTAKSAFDVPGPIRDKWAIVIGIGSFHDQTIEPLRCAVKNATDLAGILKDPSCGHFAPDHVSVLKELKTTKYGIENVLSSTWLGTKALPNDMVVLYVCTRTVPSKEGDDIILLCADSEASDAAETGIPLKAMLTDLRRRLQSRNILCVLDTSPASESAYNPEIPMQPSIEEICKETGVSILSANLPELPSYESTLTPNSFFCSFFSLGLQVANGLTPVITLGEYVKQGVSELVDVQIGKKETPILALAEYTTLGGTPIGTVVKSSTPKSIKFGHPIDQLAMKRPDLASRQRHPEDAQDSDDDEDEDAKPKAPLDFGTYMSKMKQQIQAKWQPPKGMENRKIAVIFTIKRDGSIIEPQIVESSGEPKADAAAMEALTAASPLEPLPLGAPKSVQIRYQFTWRISRSDDSAK
ncbi:MAG: TonB C-terminal domain-containing protein [Candidatus Obscuribacterales bacterium]|nr:TonB C-terminal domain-containing protein [Candidatus Obscuribacterales bacterium]